MTKHAKGTLALVPAAARSPKRSAKPADVPSPVVATIEAFETAIGGRKALIETLSVAENSEEVYAILSLIGDERFDRWPLAKICQRGNISPGQLFQALKAAALARAQVLSLVAVADKSPEITKQLLDRSVEHTVPCDACNGTGQCIDKPSKKVPKPESYTCSSCVGTGRVQAEADLERVQMALEMAGLLKKSSGVNVATQVNVTPAAPTGSLVQLQQAIGEIMYGRSPAPEPAEPPIVVEAPEDDRVL